MSPQDCDKVVLRAQGDHYLDPWLTPQSDAMKAIAQEAIGQLQSYERYYGLRKRARKAADQASMEKSVTALICACTVHHLVERSGRLKVSRSHRTLRKDRYKTPLTSSSKVPDFLDYLSAPEIPWLHQIKGVQTPADVTP